MKNTDVKEKLTPEEAAATQQTKDEKGCPDKNGTQAENEANKQAEDAGTPETEQDAKQPQTEDEISSEDAPQDEENIADTSEDGAEEKKKKSFFSKKDKKDKRDEKIEELNDKLLRNLAEFENFRNRSEREKAQMFEIGAKSVVEKILPTIDNFERGLATVSEADKESPFVQGMEKVYKQFLASLEEIGVKAIEAEGKEFDPNLHNAVMHEENEEFGENIVSAELQKGYMYRDSVVRHSMVKVAN